MEGSPELEGYGQKDNAHRGAIHKLQQLYIRRAGELRRLSLSFFTILKYLLLFLGKNPAEH